MCVLTCVVHEPARVGLPAATLRSIGCERGALVALEHVAGRMNRKLAWHEGPDPFSKRDELALYVLEVGFSVMSRPEEANREAAREKLAASVLALYLDELDAFEAELAAVQANLAGATTPATSPAPAGLPLSGARDMFTGEARMPSYSDAPAPRSDQRSLF
jgi:hypothetical protein